MPPHTFHTILIANRGEIACRIMHTAHALGYRTVAVFSPVDEKAPHVALADEAVMLAGNEPTRSYLDIEQLLAAAKKAGADAVHPGYGFLAENADFACACVAAGLVFIGPSAESIRSMGNKREAKVLMEQAGVPVIPGARGPAQAPDALLEAARELGCPVMIKAAAGGGGKGMRRVDRESDLAEGIRAAASEARNSFGDDELIIEKAIDSARHIEIQVFADQHGQVIHLGERDCSMQRRHQKIIEESPSPVVNAELRQRMGEAACQAARAIDYVGAGTVEFLLDAAGQFYFLEMNTRLQVEHPVTELVTGLDLVAWQLQVAAGQPLALSQDQVDWQGHAIEARLYAEAPDQGFMPQSGPLLYWQAPGGEGVRVDAGVDQGQRITPYYDPLIAKIIAHGPDRETARRRLLKALEDTRALGVRTNRAYLCRALAHPAMIAADVTTGFVATHGDDLRCPGLDPADKLVIAAVLARVDSESDPLISGRDRGQIMDVQLDSGSGPETERLRLTSMPAGWQLVDQPDAGQLETFRVDGHRLEYRIAGLVRRMGLVGGRDCLWLADRHHDIEVVDNTLAAPVAVEEGDQGRILAPMDGVVIEVQAGDGDMVDPGSPVLVMEAMKMETTLRAATAGVIEGLTVRAGDQVRKGQLLARINSPDDDE
jgi:geranyl-CoA carboxylase alpha subunit